MSKQTIESKINTGSTELSIKNHNNKEIRVTFQHEKESEKAIFGKLDIYVEEGDNHYKNMMVWIPKSKLNDMGWIIQNKNIRMHSLNLLKTRQPTNEDAKIGQKLLVGLSGNLVCEIVEVLDKEELAPNQMWYNVRIKPSTDQPRSNYESALEECEHHPIRNICYLSVIKEDATCDYIKWEETAT